MKEIKNILSLFPEELHCVFNMIDSSVLDRLSEIRLRRNKPIVIVIKNTSYFIDYNGDIYDSLSRNCVITDEKVFENTFMTLCNFSLYSNMESLKNGFITLPYGARMGVASTVVCDDTGPVSIKEVTSLNVRIPSRSKGCSNGILNFLYINSFPSVIVAGKPNSGKTTLLRDMAYRLSDGFNYKYRKICIVDERNEFGGKYQNDFLLDVGANTDVLTGFEKAKGIEIAARTLSPEMIVCDEISTQNELDSIKFAFSSGIKFALSVHIGDKSDLFTKPIIRDLLSTGEFEYIILLDEYTYKPEVIEVSEITNEIGRCIGSDLIRNIGRSDIMR